MTGTSLPSQRQLFELGMQRLHVYHQKGLRILVIAKNAGRAFQ